MFNSKKKDKQINNSAELVTKVNQDLLVRNMPSAARLTNTGLSSSMSPAKVSPNVLSTVVKPENKHQAVGMVIIGGGLILIGALVYLSYVFIIKPQTKKETPVVNQAQEPVKSSVINMQIATGTEVSSPTVNDVATVTPTTVDFVSSSSLTTMAEESTGRSDEDLPPLLDSDQDGLLDDEELVLGTSVDMEDSNSNSYTDLIEINNNYNPADSGKLSANINLTAYSNENFSYSVLYPKDWEFNLLSEESVLVFNTPDDSLIQMSVQENSDKQSILAWYSDSFPDDAMTYDKLKSTDTWDGISSSDGLNFYLIDKKRANIYTISYIPAVSGRIAYPNIFKLIINSLLIE